MPTKVATYCLPAYIRTIFEEKGRGARAVRIGRPFLFDRYSDSVLELQTAYIDNEYAGDDALNTQIAALNDLAFLYAWCNLMSASDTSWIAPELRAKAGLVCLSEVELAHFSMWAGLSAKDISRALARAASSANIKSLPAGTPIANGQFNRRLRTASGYMQWVFKASMSGGETPSMEQAHACDIECRRLEDAFNKKLKRESGSLPLRSLTSGAAAQLREQTRTRADEACAERDRLIARLLLEGPRAGELLLLRTSDVFERYELDTGQTAAILSFQRQPNSADETRMNPPAVKTLPGDLPISKELASDIVHYINTWRRETLNKVDDPHETLFVFICHSGPQSGQPISQRNLNRIVAKLKGQGLLPMSISPHVLRHTSMDDVVETASANGKSAEDIREVLLERGRWSPNSNMPQHYTRRVTRKKAAEYVEERDSRFARHA